MKTDYDTLIERHSMDLARAQLFLIGLRVEYTKAVQANKEMGDALEGIALTLGVTGGVDEIVAAVVSLKKRCEKEPSPKKKKASEATLYPFPKGKLI